MNAMTVVQILEVLEEVSDYLDQESDISGGTGNYGEQLPNRAMELKGKVDGFLAGRKESA